jgi:hypothetical protein
MKRLDAEMTFPFRFIPHPVQLFPPSLAHPSSPSTSFLANASTRELTALGSSSAGEHGAKLSARQTLKGINPLSIPGAHNAQTSKLVN